MPFQFNFFLISWYSLQFYVNYLYLLNIYHLKFTQYSTHECESVSHSVMSDSLRTHGLYPCRLLCPWNSPDKNTGFGCYSFLKRIEPGFLHCRRILYCLSHQGNPILFISILWSVNFFYHCCKARTLTISCQWFPEWQSYLSLTYLRNVGTG